MKISVFSKFEMAGGSEFRSIELANGITRFTNHQAFILAEKKFSLGLKAHVYPEITVIENSFEQPQYFYDSDAIIIVNTDMPDFSTLDYWIGKSPDIPIP